MELWSSNEFLYLLTNFINYRLALIIKKGVQVKIIIELIPRKELSGKYGN